jgi:hypothetical protein
MNQSPIEIAGPGKFERREQKTGTFTLNGNAAVTANVQ